jgi:predicted amidohydrolase
MQHLITAGIQISVEPNNFKYNIEKASDWLIKTIKELKPQLVIFPETITTGFSPSMKLNEFYNFLPDNLPNLFRPLMKICKNYKTYCIITSYEKSKRKNVIYNSAFLIDKYGEIAGIYRKTHLFPTEKISNNGWTTPGYKIEVFKTEIANIGIMICYDGDFPEVARILSLKGAEIIARPSAFLRSFEIWELTNKARAYDNNCYVIAVNAVGSDKAGNNYFGHSMIVSPIAQTLALARGTEEVLFAELKPLPIKSLTYGVKTKIWIDHIKDRNIKSYKNFYKKEI